jgi:hypothetical protein
LVFFIALVVYTAVAKDDIQGPGGDPPRRPGRERRTAAVLQPVEG